MAFVNTWPRAAASAPPLPPPEAIDRSSRAPAILAVNWTFALIAIIVVVTRHYVRRNIVRRLAIDDYLIFITLALSLTMSSMLTAAVHFGMGRHVEALMASPNGPKNLETTMKLTLIAEFFVISTPCVGRISYAFLLLAIIPPVKWRKYFLWSIIALEAIIDLTMITIALAICRPIQSFWQGKREDCLPATVQVNFGYFQGSFSGLVDLVLALFPATLFWNLQLKLSLKVSLSVLMGLGVFAMISSIMKTINLKHLTRLDDPTWLFSDLVIWCSLEAYLVLIAASIPTLRPLMGRKLNPSSHAGEYTPYGSGRKGTREGYDSIDRTGITKAVTYDVWSSAAPSQSTESQRQLHSVTETSQEDIALRDALTCPIPVTKASP